MEQSIKKSIRIHYILMFIENPRANPISFHTTLTVRNLLTSEIYFKFELCVILNSIDVDCVVLSKNTVSNCPGPSDLANENIIKVHCCWSGDLTNLDNFFSKSLPVPRYWMEPGECLTSLPFAQMIANSGWKLKSICYAEHKWEWVL